MKKMISEYMRVYLALGWETKQNVVEFGRVQGEAQTRVRSVPKQSALNIIINCQLSSNQQHHRKG